MSDEDFEICNNTENATIDRKKILGKIKQTLIYEGLLKMYQIIIKNNSKNITFK